MWKQKLQQFIKSNENSPKLVALAAGLYPFLHYYNSNLSIADSVEQLLFLIIICFLVPQILVGLSPFVLRTLKLQVLEKYRLIQLNIGVFISLLIVLILHLNRYYSLLVLIVFITGGFLLYKHLKKIVVLQFLLAIMSFVMLIPKLYFSAHVNNDWAKIPDSVLEVALQKKPNIFVIQPDGYVNISQIKNAPYNFDNSNFEDWLTDNTFINYPNFRSNYYSTLTSNASMFAMKHHYYKNTNKQTLKTHKIFNVIVGEENNVLKILKNNNYRTHLLTDNSFFLINRTPLYFDFCNVSKDKVSYYDTGGIDGVDIIKDFTKILDTIPKSENFFFIEKTIPSHIIYEKRFSKGIEEERLFYLERLREANHWLKELVTRIKEFDKDALIVIVADHGGFVGLEYTLEAVERKLNALETVSSFSSMLSIKWPKEIEYSGLNFKTNVNLFRQVFYVLSNEKAFLDGEESNTSYLPLKKSLGADYYKCINEKDAPVYEKIND